MTQLSDALHHRPLDIHSNMSSNYDTIIRRL